MTVAQTTTTTTAAEKNKHRFHILQLFLPRLFLLPSLMVEEKSPSEGFAFSHPTTPRRGKKRKELTGKKKNN